MTQTGMDDKRQPQYPAADQGVGGKAVSGWKEIFDDGKLVKWIWAETFLIQLQVSGCCLEVGPGQVIGFRKKIGRSGYVSHLFLPHNIGSDRKTEASDGILDQPGGNGLARLDLMPFQSAGRYGQHAFGCDDLQYIT